MVPKPQNEDEEGKQGPSERQLALIAGWVGGVGWDGGYSLFLVLLLLCFK